MPNFAFHHLLRTTPRAGRWALGSVRALIDCSEPCKPQTLRAFIARFAACGLREGALAASYGMAENVFIATQTRPGTAPRSLRADRAAFAETARIVAPEAGAPEVEFLSCGPPIPRTEIRVLDEAGVALRERAVGEIAVSSPYLFAGYHRAPLPEGRFADGWYRTGDLGFLDDGEIFVCGRTDDLLIVNGRNVYAHDVEFAINARTPVRPGRCVAIAPESARTGSRVLVVIAESDAGDPAALAEAIRAVVEAEFGFPPGEVRIEAPGWMVKTTSGKVSRGANLAKYLGEDAQRAGAAREV
jgi:acyl-CoA synthetase (AMP-forming)/AMP-acid ligase II